MIKFINEAEAKHRASTAKNVWSEACWGKHELLHSGNCQHCELRKDYPNYAGWARIYVEAGQTITKKQADAFMQELESDNTAYVEALKQSILYFGLIIY